MTQSKPNYRRFYFFSLVINSALGYACLGYNFSIFNTLQNYLQSHVFPDTSTTEVSLIASSLSIGAAFGSLLASSIIAKVGRRTTMLGVDILGILGLVLTIIPSLGSILTGRIIAGIVAGINNVVVPIYLVEISPLQMCGASGSMSIIILELFNFISLAMGFVVPASPDGDMSDGVWRILFAAPAVLHIIRFLTLTLVYKFETPFVYIQKQQTEKAKAALKKVFTSDVDIEYTRIHTDVQTSTSQGTESFKDLFSKKYRKNFFVCFLLSVIQQFSGLPALFSFSNDILSKSTDDTDLFSTLLGVVNLSSVIISFGFIEKFGRKSLIVTGTLLVGIQTLAFGIMTHINDTDSSLKYILILWPIFFQVSLGSLTFLYVSEALPPVGVSWCIAVNWISAFVICQCYLQTAEALGSASVFIFFGVFSIVSAIIFWYMLVETKGRTKSEIILSYMGCETRDISQSDKNGGTTSPSEKKENSIEMAKPDCQEQNQI